MSLSFSISAEAGLVEEKEDVIVIYNNIPSQNAIKISSHGGKMIKKYDNLSAAHIEASKSQIEQIKRDPNVVIVGENEPIQLPGIELKEAIGVNAVQTKDWGINAVGATNAWNAGITGKGVKIAVLDTGVEWGHPDLKIKGGVSFISEQLPDGSVDTSVEDYHGHGTHVAGIIAAQNNGIGTVGVAPDSEIYAIKVLNGSGKGDTLGLMDAIEWCIDNNMDIANLSLGSQSGSDFFRHVIDNANASGLIITSAAGNDNDEDTSGVDYPAKYDSTIAVAAIDKFKKHANFSSVGNEVDVAAPGVGIISTYLNGQYASMSGTSMATPYTSGVLALYKQANPFATPETIKQMLYAKLEDVEAPGRDDKTGLGLVKAPTSWGVISTPYDKKITFFSTELMYTKPQDSARTNYYLGPQSVQAVEKYGSWIKIRTWVGDHWIKPNLSLEGNIQQTFEEITISQMLNGYNVPGGDVIRKGLKSGHYVSYQKVGNWYEIEFEGKKMWVNTTTVQNQHYVNIRLNYRTDLYNESDLRTKTASLAPQAVRAYEKKGNAYKIQTWLGFQWISPTYEMKGAVTPYEKQLVLTNTTTMHSLPFADKKTNLYLAPQTVNAVNVWGNWYEIRTWVGNMWVYLP